MITPIDFPHDKLGYVLSGKQREQIQKYDTRDTFDGRMLTRGVRDSSTVYFDVDIKVMQSKSLFFAIWLRSVSNGEEFKITLNTESGLTEHTCRWDTMPLTPQEGDNFYVYSGVLYCDALNNGVEEATDDQLCLYWNVGECIGNLDRTVNVEWPA